MAMVIKYDDYKYLDLDDTADALESGRDGGAISKKAMCYDIAPRELCVIIAEHLVQHQNDWRS
jgi:hypothetical protein